MFLLRLKRIAEVIGLIWFVLLSIYGGLTVHRGDHASVANSPSPQSEPVAITATVPLMLNYQGTLRDPAANPRLLTTRLISNRSTVENWAGFSAWRVCSRRQRGEASLV
jgi:hypothetical protein